MDHAGRAVRTGPHLAPGPEFDLIRRFLPAWEGRPDVRVGPGDDCAVVTGDGIALSSDMSVEGVHFRREWMSAADIGHRAAASALSDLAATAARPIGVLVSLALPPGDEEDVAVGVMEGVAAAARGAGAIILGGDTVRTAGPLVVNVTVVGECSEPVTRDGAGPGDELWVTGDLGGAAAVVDRLLRGLSPPPDAWARFAAPVPRVQEARWLAERGIPRAMIDLSDGLAGDAAHLAAAGGVRVLLDPRRIPIHPALGTPADADAIGLAVAGGEDFELCFAARPGSVTPRLAEFVARFAVRLTRVGRVVAGEGVAWEGEKPTPLPRAGFQHFGEGSA